MTRAAQLDELRSILNGIICERKWALHKLTGGNLPITHEITRQQNGFLFYCVTNRLEELFSVWKLALSSLLATAFTRLHDSAKQVPPHISSDDLVHCLAIAFIVSTGEWLGSGMFRLIIGLFRITMDDLRSVDCEWCHSSVNLINEELTGNLQRSLISSQTTLDVIDAQPPNWNNLDCNKRNLM